VLVSPAEPAALRALGTVSAECERMGADFLLLSATLGVIGVQRKTVTDLIGSLADGRVERELIDMRKLGIAIWVIEGEPEWGEGGQCLTSRVPYTITHHHGVLLSLMLEGGWVMTTRDMRGTMGLLKDLQAWALKREHISMRNRAGKEDYLGLTVRENWQIHLLQSFPGVGFKTARGILSHFGGLPFALKEGCDLTEVKGVGKKTAAKITEMLDDD
jgi:ERCC4-type nuclease